MAKKKMAKKKTVRRKKIKVVQAAAKERVGKIFPILKKTYPDAKIALEFDTPVQLLVAVILSAQCTDVRVNVVTKDLFKKYKNVEAFAGADIEEFQQDVRSTGFYRNKAKNIMGATKRSSLNMAARFRIIWKNCWNCRGLVERQRTVYLAMLTIRRGSRATHTLFV